MKKKRVLIIDDEEDFDYFIKVNLEQKGDFEVITATNGKDGIKAAISQHPDLILLDIMMPQMDGFEVLKNLRSINSEARKIPVIMLTANRETKNMFKAKSLRISDYVMKPFSMDKLSGLITKYIEINN